MRAEDRLAQVEPEHNTAYVEALFDLAREAIALLREVIDEGAICMLKDHEVVIARWGKCPYCDLEERAHKFLDGEEERP